MNDSWPFDQGKDVAALTTRQVMKEGFPVLHVVHYSDDHSWAFTCGTTDDTNDLMVVCMEHIVEIDPTIRTIADLSPGWVAVRDAIGAPWEIYHDEEM